MVRENFLHHVLEATSNDRVMHSINESVKGVFLDLQFILYNSNERSDMAFCFKVFSVQLEKKDEEVWLCKLISTFYNLADKVRNVDQ